MLYIKIRFERKCYFKDKNCKILHREDGSAVEYWNGNKQYWLNDEIYSEKDYWAVVRFGGFA